MLQRLVGGVNDEMSRGLAIIALREQGLILCMFVTNMGNRGKPNRYRGWKGTISRSQCIRADFFGIRKGRHRDKRGKGFCNRSLP